MNNQTLSGKYFFRQVSLGTDSTGNLTDPRSLIGTITFDSAGGYSYNAPLVQGVGAATAQSDIGKYTVDSAGFVSLDSPARKGDKVNARFSPEALLGSTTESSGNTFDVFVAIPAPVTAPTAASFSGSYWVATLEFPGGTYSGARNTIFSLKADGIGAFPAGFTVTGHAANFSAGQSTNQEVTGATYTVATDGTVTATFGTSSTLLNGSKTIYLSQDGNILLGGSTANGSHDILIGVKAISGATNATWSGNYWAAGLRHDSTAVTDYAGSIAPRGTGNFIWTRRLKVSGVGNVDFTGVNSYLLNADGSGNAELTRVALGAAGKAFIGSSVSPNDAGGYEIYFGAQMPATTGTGVFLNPQGVVNAASFAPTGNPIAPGGFLSLYGSGLAKSPQTATPPYPQSLNGVTVLINNQPAPLYTVSDGRIDLLVPFATHGATAAIVVQNGAATSNTVSVPVAATAPGLLTVAQNGAGLAAMQHADYSQITSAHPAHGGETVVLYVTGLGAINPPVADGASGGTNPASTTVVTPTVLVGGKPGVVIFSGLTIYPGLYQINVTLPAVPSGVTSLPLAISTPNAYHDQVDIAVQP